MRLAGQAAFPDGADRADSPGGRALPTVLTTSSAIDLLGEPAMRWRVRSGRWQQPCRGVLVTHSGPVGDGEALWIALLAAGPQAVLGGLTAAGLDGLTGFETKAVLPIASIFGADLAFWNQPSALGIIVSIAICIVASLTCRFCA